LSVVELGRIVEKRAAAGWVARRGDVSSGRRRRCRARSTMREGFSGGFLPLCPSGSGIRQTNLHRVTSKRALKIAI
jgi:hypothetical protein